MLQGYQDIIDLQVEWGIIEQVPTSEIQTENVTHYLPHHPVDKLSSKTTKVRIVYDASSKLKRSDVTLNECMLRGPVILPDLCQLLMRLRTYRIVISSDIEKAFLQISLQKHDRDVTRFLWYKDSKDLRVTPSNMATYRFCRVPFRVISSPFLLGATIQHHLAAQGTDFATNLKCDIYVDNVISCLADESACINYYSQVKQIFRTAGMNLTEFCSNSKDLMDKVPSEDKVKDPTIKLLGIKWDSHDTDSLKILKSGKWSLDAPVTKRIILRKIASIFDPLGMFQPALLAAKLLLQETWVQKFDWDQTLPEEFNNQWNEIQQTLEPIFNCSLPRQIGIIYGSSCLVAFSDASGTSYGAAVYLRTVSNGQISTNLLFAKTRLAPINQRQCKRQAVRTVTLPRLELLGATVAAKMLTFCRKAFDPAQFSVHLFIDSECVLHWIKTGRTLKRFVARRAELIRALPQASFHYVSTKDNPADLLTRGQPAEDLINNHFWWHGPAWISKPEDKWPKYELSDISSEALQEISQEKPTEISHSLATQAKERPTGLMDIDINRFSSLKKLLRVTTICLKYLKIKVFDKIDHSSNQSLDDLAINQISSQPTITADDYRTVEMIWIRSIQQSEYEDVFTAIHQRKKHPLFTQLGVKIDEQGLLRSHSRLQPDDMPEATKFPVLMPKSHPFSKLVVLDIHEKLHHAGVNHTLSDLRKSYWIPQGRSLVRNTLRRCFICRRFKSGQPFALPEMPLWPKERVKRSAPFQYTGLDYFGPIKVKIKDKPVKMWACLFTCLTTRAVHLEAVADCSTPEFLHSLTRFVSRRGCPEVIISDNAAQFKLTNILLEKAWKKVPLDSSITSFSAQKGVKWKFITELSPWQGGHYERLVGVVKSALKTAIGRRMLTWTDFITLLTETEAIVNSRPITYVSDDAESCVRILTPNDFLSGQPLNFAANDIDFSSKNWGDAGKILVSIWKQRKRHLVRVWQTWYEDYLLSLRERSNSTHRNRRSSNFRIPREGEVVLLLDEDQTRNWRLAKIQKLIPSGDGKTRSAVIKLGNGIELRLAINHLIPLEIQNFDQNSSVSNSNQTQLPTPQTSPNNSSNNNNFQINQNLGDLTNGDAIFFGFSPEDVLRTIEIINSL